MEKKQLLPLLINHYEQTIKEISKLRFKESIFNRLLKLNVTNGICFCSLKEFNIKIYDEDWVKKYDLPPSGYWCEKPSKCKTKKTIIESLQFRVDKMKEILATL